VFPLIILLYSVRTRRWRVVFSAAAGILTISALTIGVLGWNQILSFLGSTSAEVWERWTFANSNVSIGATIAQLVLPLMATDSPGDHLLLWQLIFAASALALGAAVFWVTPVSDPDLRAFGLWIIAATWMFPICWPAHMVLFLAFLGVLFCSRSRASRQAKWAAVSSYALGVMLLPIHWTLLIAGHIAWLAAAERTCLVMLVLSSFYSAWLFSRPEIRPVALATPLSQRPSER
jgi:Glycosyltransferase family 87